ncbi:MAG TPA: Gfo/Idh/MocA family oxidoreductase [Gemmatales bacterium]|nr:Gfo/Idh/MocA family oxidoreductase [Gemmatales bacterium]
MSIRLNRRHFIAAVTSSIAALPAMSYSRVLGANETVRLGIMGMSRGKDLAGSFAKVSGAFIATVCDVDQKRLATAATAVEKLAGKPLGITGDFRNILDDKSVDALVCSAPNFWHAPASILACTAGKHVYVEKPCSHTPQEGVLLVAAARKHQRKVQMGNQRRSYAVFREAMTALRDGLIGHVTLAKCWYGADSKSIGTGKPTAVPAHLDYELWQGPVERKPYQDNVVHYNWHWFWHWGNGELGNNGVHMIDLCRWGLGVTYPSLVTSSGGRYHFQDDQQTPDTHIVTFDFPSKQSIVWEGLSCINHHPENNADAVFHGDKGTLVLRSGGYVVLDTKGKEIRKVPGPTGDVPHVTNFIHAIRENTALNSEIEEGHLSTLLCHLGNIAHRTTHAILCDPATGQPTDATPRSLWTKSYASGWEPRV